jgi:hypothetical protein
MAYIDVAYLLEHKYLTEIADEAYISRLLEANQQRIERWTGRIFRAYEQTRLVDVKRTITFPNPIIQVHALTWVSSHWPGGPVGVDIDRYVIRNEHYPEYRADSYNIDVYVSCPPGVKTMKVQASLGYLQDGDTPEMIKHALAMLTVYSTSPTYSEEIARRHLKRETTDGHSYELDPIASIHSLSGFPLVDEILQIYKRKALAAEMAGGLA